MGCGCGMYFRTEIRVFSAAAPWTTLGSPRWVVDPPRRFRAPQLSEHVRHALCFSALRLLGGHLANGPWSPQRESHTKTVATATHAHPLIRDVPWACIIKNPALTTPRRFWPMNVPSCPARNLAGWACCRGGACLRRMEPRCCSGVCRFVRLDALCLETKFPSSSLPSTSPSYRSVHCSASASAARSGEF